MTRRRYRLRALTTVIGAGAMLGVAGGALRRRLGGATVIGDDDPRMDVRLAAPGVVRGSVSVGIMTYPLAVPFCGLLERLALETGSRSLVMDMSSLSKATPRAGMYALVRMKRFPLRRIALLHGSPFMRAFATTVLTLGRFPEFRFFDDEDAAVAWSRPSGG